MDEKRSPPARVAYLHGPAEVNAAAARAEVLTRQYQAAELAALAGLEDITRPYAREGEPMDVTISRMPEPARSAVRALWDAITAAP